MTPLSIQHVDKSYNGAKVLEDIHFDLRKGELFGLIGLNGAGKTTLIKIILDLVKADKGEVEIFAQSSHIPAARENLSYLPEKFQPSRYLKGREYIDLTLAYYGRKISLDEARKHVAALDLNPDRLGDRVGSYSKGMGQKLGLAASMLADRPLLILDEPMSGLDPLARIKLKEELLAQKNTGKTLFFSSHILSDIDEICDRIGVLHDGRMLFIGTPADFKQQSGQSVLEQAFLSAIQQPRAA